MSHGYVFILLCYIGYGNHVADITIGGVYTYRRGAFALLVSTNRAMREP